MPRLSAIVKLLFSEVLMMACISLDRNLPPPSNEVDQTVEFPALRPEERPRHDSVAGCPICAAEIADVDAGVRAGHVCNHQRQGAEGGGQNEDLK